MSTLKKLPPAFEMQFTGPGIYPERIPLGVLSRAFAALQRLAQGAEGSDEDEELVSLPEEFGLLQVKRGSAIYQISTGTPELAIARLTETGKVLVDPESIGDRDFMLGPVDELSCVARKLDSTIVIRTPGREGTILARVVPDSYSCISRSLFIEGETTVFGRVQRVGGVTATKCALRLENRTRLLFCGVATEAVARQLGEKLYQQVAARGTAKWMKTNWKIIRFSIHEVHQPKLKPFNEMIESLRNAGGSDWDRIPDPETFLK